MIAHTSGNQFCSCFEVSFTTIVRTTYGWQDEKKQQLCSENVQCDFRNSSDPCETISRCLETWSLHRSKFLTLARLAQYIVEKSLRTVIAHASGNQFCSCFEVSFTTIVRTYGWQDEKKQQLCFKNVQCDFHNSTDPCETISGCLENWSLHRSEFLALAKTRVHPFRHVRSRFCTYDF